MVVLTTFPRWKDSEFWWTVCSVVRDFSLLGKYGKSKYIDTCCLWGEVWLLKRKVKKNVINITSFCIIIIPDVVNSRHTCSILSCLSSKKRSFKAPSCRRCDLDGTGQVQCYLKPSQEPPTLPKGVQVAPLHLISGSSWDPPDLLISIF